HDVRHHRAAARHQLPGRRHRPVRHQRDPDYHGGAPGAAGARGEHQSAGGVIAASFMGYNVAKRFARDKDSFGTGRIEGVFAPETAAHAAGTSALLPMLALGIPGSGTAAILLGGLMVWGLNPGPLLFVEHKDFVWGLIASMYLGNIVGLVMVLSTVPLFAAVLRVPFSAIAPMIVVSCAVGAYAIQNAMF